MSHSVDHKTDRETQSNTVFPMWSKQLQEQALTEVKKLGDDRIEGCYRLMLETGVRPSDAIAVKGSYVKVKTNRAYISMPISKQTKAIYTKKRNEFIKKRLLEIAEGYKASQCWGEYHDILDLTTNKPQTKIVDGETVTDGKKTYLYALYEPRMTKDGAKPTPNAVRVLSSVLGCRRKAIKLWRSIWNGAVNHGEKCKADAMREKNTSLVISLELADFLLSLNSKTEDDYIFSSELSTSNNKSACNNPYMSRQNLWKKLTAMFKRLEDQVNTLNDNEEHIKPFKLSVYSLRKTYAYNIYQDALASGKDALALARDALNHSLKGDGKVTLRYLMVLEQQHDMFINNDFPMTPANDDGYQIAA